MGRDNSYVELGETRNTTNADVISTQSGRAVVRVMKTNEERTIAEMACDLLGIRRAVEAKP